MTLSPAFHEVRFPVDISLGSSGGPERSTEIVTLGSGHEQRNQRWSLSRRKFDAGYGVKGLDALHDVIAFFEARRGPLFGFRFRDPLDWKSCNPSQTPDVSDQQIGIGTGDEFQFQLVKSYGEGENGHTRPISKPVADTVRVAVDGQEQVLQSEFVVDPTSGSISFVTPPVAGALITAGFEFDVPVRFLSEQLSVNLDAFAAGQVPNISLIEVRP